MLTTNARTIKSPAFLLQPEVPQPTSLQYRRAASYDDDLMRWIRRSPCRDMSTFVDFRPRCEYDCWFPGISCGTMQNKLIILELNELTPRLMSQFIDEGVLPNFVLRESQRTADLRRCHAKPF
jgi:hypothetical protein